MTENINFGTMNVNTLFRRLLVPTLLGMIFSGIFVITDGIFVGRGIGSDALAAINISAPIFMFNSGIALMFGIGASVVASIQLSRGKQRAARISITQSVAVCASVMTLIAVFMIVDADGISRMLGCSDRLLPLTSEYIMWFAPFLPFCTLLHSGLFYIRLDGAVNYAMMCNIVAAFSNMVLDYLLIIVFDMGVRGAAIASSLGHVIGVVMMLAYMLQKRHVLHLCRLRMSMRGVASALRSAAYMCRLGFSTFLCQMAVAVMMFMGNIQFMRYLGEDGVAAYSIACYFFPLVYMVNNAIAQSAQPIISYNYGCGSVQRVRKALRLALITALTFGTAAFVTALLFPGLLTVMFVTADTAAYAYSAAGLPYFALGFVFFGINMVCIGYFQSVEREWPANTVTLVRGYLLVCLCFWLLPQVWGTAGLWLAVPAADFLSLFLVAAIYLHDRRRSAAAR